MVGLILGLIKNLMYIGYALIESLVFMIVYNYLAVTFIKWGVPLPIDNISWKFSWALLILIYMIGDIIKNLSPFYFKHWEDPKKKALKNPQEKVTKKVKSFTERITEKLKVKNPNTNECIYDQCQNCHNKISEWHGLIKCKTEGIRNIEDLKNQDHCAVQTEIRENILGS